jgi:hypothetical protein
MAPSTLELLVSYLPLTLICLLGWWMLGRHTCDLCGVRTKCKKVHAANKQGEQSGEGGAFWLCRRCGRVANSSNIAVADLIAQGIATRRNPGASETSRRRSDHVGDFVIIIAVIAGCYVYFWHPEWIRMSGQAPVAVHVRGSLVGVGNVVQVRNESQSNLTNVIVEVVNRGSNSARRAAIGDLAPGETKELGTIDERWGWVIERSEKITVRADGFSPIMFSAEQVGVR